MLQLGKSRIEKTGNIFRDRKPDLLVGFSFNRMFDLLRCQPICAAADHENCVSRLRGCDRALIDLVVFTVSWDASFMSATLMELRESAAVTGSGARNWSDGSSTTPIIGRIG